MGDPMGPDTLSQDPLLVLSTPTGLATASELCSSRRQLEIAGFQLFPAPAELEPAI